MREYLTEALVLDKEDKGENDALVSLYTKNLGKVFVRATSLRKIKSKSSAHLEPLNFVRVRFVGNGHFRLIDAISFNREFVLEAKQSAETLAGLLRAAQFIKEMAAEHQRDAELWQLVEKIFSGRLVEPEINRELLKVFGFDLKFARCHWCKEQSINYFCKNDHIFFCPACASNAPDYELILVGKPLITSHY